MKKQIFALLAIFGLAGATFAQTSATIYGYVRGEFAFDSRQVSGNSARDGNYIDLVDPVNMVNGKDANATPNFNGWGIESRLGVKISGPEFFGMKSSAILESHFFGATEATINSLALRHAYVQLDNDNVEIKVGQFWHPMFVTNVSPGTYNFNAGSPFQPFNRSPQIRITTKGNVRFIGAALTELDFRTAGPVSRSAAISGLPAFHAQLQFGDDNKFVGGVGVNYKFNRWALGSDVAGAYNFLAYAKAKLGAAQWQVYGNYGQNPSELLQIGSWGLDGAGKPQSNKVLALWTEFSGDFDSNLEWGVFGGYTKNGGFDQATSNIRTFIQPVNSSWRVSPRLGWKMGNTKFTGELDYTNVEYGNYDAAGKSVATATNAQGAGTVGNFRVSLSLIQSF